MTTKRLLILSVVFSLLFSSCASLFPAKAGSDLPRKGETFVTPVKSIKSFDSNSSWLVSEPGSLLDNATAWTIPGTEETWHANVPEGGFWYASCGQCKIKIDNVQFDLKPEKGLNYLILFRGIIDDGIVDNDLNQTAEVTDFVAGHMIYSHMPSGAYVSANWFRQQMVAASTDSFTNCGATGCSRLRIVLFDVASHKYQLFAVSANALDTWVLLESN